MPVTELAILPLSPLHTSPLSPSPSISLPTLSPPLLQKLLTAKTALQTALGYPFHYYRQIENPHLFYFLGTWDSVTHHHTFLSSPENKTLLELLREDIVMHGEGGMKMWHLDSDIFALGREMGRGERKEKGGNKEGEKEEGKEAKKSVFDAEVISINRHFIPSPQKSAFSDKFSSVQHLLENYTKPFQVVGGWRIEKEKVKDRDEEGEGEADGDGKEREEWVLFSGFESVEQHMGFAKTREFEEYRGIVGFVQGFEVRHLRRVEGL